jgi:hypothetical protein
MSEYRNEFQYGERFQVHEGQLRVPWKHVIVSGIFSRFHEAQRLRLGRIFCAIRKVPDRLRLRIALPELPEHHSVDDLDPA